jgi:hypothetical protein
MNTKVIVGLTVVGVLGVGAYLFMGNKGTSVAEVAMPESSREAAAGPFTGSVFDLAQRGGSWKCTVDTTATTGAGAAMSAGTVHVSGTSVRADFTTTIAGMGPVESHMITDGSFAYTWTSMMPRGFKMKVDSTQTAQADATSQTSGEGMDAHQSYTYNCEKESPDATLFTPPSSISFVEM